MRYLLTSLFFVALSTCVLAQIGAKTDAEYLSWCMVDVRPNGNVVRFTRILNVATLQVRDVNPLNGFLYSVRGTVSTCEEYDLEESTRGAYDDIYEDCQCVYSIAQEDHRVDQINGGADQTFRIGFNRVIRRKCGEGPDVVFSRTPQLSVNTPSIRGEIKYTFSFNSVGDYIQDLDVRVYTPSNGVQNYTLVLDPNTVVAEYPTLNLNVSDFEYSGSNNAAMAAAYATVLQHVLDDNSGAVSNPWEVIPIGGGSVVFSADLQHRPTGNYLLFPRSADADYAINISGSVTISEGLSWSNTTSDSDYETPCGLIDVKYTARYLDWNRLTPLDIIPRTGITASVIDQLSNPTRFCDADPQVCADAAQMGNDSTCVSICDTVNVNVVNSATTVEVANEAGHLPVDNTTATLSAGQYNSISIYVTQGPVGVTLGGQRINYPTGWSTVWSASPGRFLTNTISIDAGGGEAIITYIR